MENNGRVDSAAEAKSLREQYEELVAHDESKILRDLEECLPNLRRFLLGHTSDGRRWPPGRLSIGRHGRQICASIAIDDFEIVCSYEADSWNEILETIDHDLENRTVSWDRSWKAKQRERAAFVNAVRGRS